MPVSKPQDLDWVKTLIFGDLGLGKTTFLGSAQNDPRTSPILIIDFEGGTRSLKGLDVDIFRVKDWDDYDKAYDLIADSNTKYKSVGIDSASETHMYALMQILEEERRERTSKKQRTDALQEADYGRGLVQMRRFLRTFRDLDMHIFFTALAIDVMEPGYGMVRKPSFAGKLQNESGMLMDVVGGLTWLPDPQRPEVMQRAMLLKNYPDWRVKIRTDWEATGWPDEIYQPTVTSLFNVLGIPMPGE